MPPTVDDYIHAQHPGLIPMLQRLRAIIRETVPDATEKIAYRVPCYTYMGSLVGFGANQKGCSFYTMNPDLPEQFADALEAYHYEASTIHFTLQQKLPVALLKKIIRRRVKENEARSKAKAAAKKK